jgi:hypothetical protein
MHLVSLKVVAPKAIIQSFSYIILSINFALVGAILLLSYTIFFMTSMKTSLCMSANRFVGSTVISQFLNVSGLTIFALCATSQPTILLPEGI